MCLLKTRPSSLCLTLGSPVFSRIPFDSKKLVTHKFFTSKIIEKEDSVKKLEEQQDIDRINLDKPSVTQKTRSGCC
jgi:hypothetical protein